ncbi:TonB-dependent receptor [Flexibacter flexilis DSM 6793]|uniref:TonB-dependent receptor n=2 Tax=Flexibacter flexilis TaxID=998 RepID=A0A1I1FRC7_9BACT|nr:TonB-dependent receptor [Flexibacter flexilis DSM 6793]
MGLSLLSITQAHATTIKGFVAELQSREPLTGATVYLENTAYNAVTGLDGSFVLKNVGAGKYKLICQFIGYQTHQQEVVVGEEPFISLNIELQPRENLLNEVKIEAKTNKESDLSARKMEQSASQVMNIVSAKAIQISPDITVANVLQRVSGVTLERSNNGDGRYAVLRGMDKRYNYTLVNGIKIPSPDPYNRYVPLDIFPSDLLQRLEVTKALTPDMEADAIGGVVNMVMKDAPEEKTLTANLGTGYGQLFFDRSYKHFDHSQINMQSPAAQHGNSYSATMKDFPWVKFKNQKPAPSLIGNISFGNRFFNQKLGLLVAGSYQNTYRGSDGYLYRTKIDAYNSPRFTELLVREYSIQQTRMGANVKMDYRLNEKNTLRLYNVYLMLDELQTRYTLDTTYKNTSVRPVLADVDILNRSRFQRQSIYNNTLQGEHEAGRFLFNWSLAYSAATNKIPDLAEQSLKMSLEGVKYQDVERIWQENDDKDKAAYLNIGYRPASRLQDLEFWVGGLYRHKNRTNSYLDYRLKASGNLATDINDINSEPYTVFNPLGIYVGANNYTAKEDISAAYFKLQFSLKQLHVLAGVRAENINQEYQTSLPKTEVGRTGKQVYTDILPSVHFKYVLNEKQNVRLSYFSSLSRPSYFEITPYNIGAGVTDNFPEAGNPYLKHTTANNIDLRYEYFGRGNDQILAGFFYKKIQNPIEYGLVAVPNSTITVYQPNNFGSATNYGFEWVGVKFLGKFGFSTNYTFTISEITTTKLRNMVIQGGITSEKVKQTRPLQGQSKHVANVSVFYKDVKQGIDVQLAWVFTGKRIIQVDQFVGLDYWQRDQSTLDLSVEKRIFKKFTVYTKIQNILNSPYQVDIRAAYPYTAATDYHYPYQDSNSRINVIQNKYGAYYLLGLRYKL